jgi:hypothetical protein
MHIIRIPLLCFLFISVVLVRSGRTQNGHLQLSNNNQPGTAAQINGIPSKPQDAATLPANGNQPIPSVDTLQSSNKNTQQAGAALPQPTTPQEQKDQIAQCKSPVRAGIGFQSGIRLHQPDKFNAFVTDIWNSTINDIADISVYTKTIGPGVFFTLNGTIDIGSRFQVAPFAQGMWAGKQFYFRGQVDKNIYINTYTALGGLNLWVRLFTIGNVSFRLGTGGYGAYTIASISGDIKKTQLAGSGFGGRTLLGVKLPLGKAVVTLDGGVSYGYTKLSHRKGDLGLSQYPIRYPSRLDHWGFEMCPGILFYF